MLLGCCHCGPQPEFSSQPAPSSLVPPSVNTPSSLFASDNSASRLPPDPQYCGACYNFPMKWQVGFASDWFEYAGDGPAGFGFPRFTDCPEVPGVKNYILSYTTAIPFPHAELAGGKTWCATWQSDEIATDISGDPCDPDSPFVPLCRPDAQSRSRVVLTAWDAEDGTGGNQTYFRLSYLWGHCSFGSVTGFAYVWSWWVVRKNSPFRISCVRNFVAEYEQAVSSWPNNAWSMPYTLSQTQNGWGTILLDPV